MFLRFTLEFLFNASKIKQVKKKLVAEYTTKHTDIIICVNITTIAESI